METNNDTSVPALLIERQQRIVRLTLNQPRIHNALTPQLIAALTTAFENVASDSTIRAVVLGGAGTSFCAGADLNWMRAAARYTFEQNLADAQALAAMFEAIDRCPCPTVAAVQGAALGGGAGLVACCDIVLATASATFAFTEVRLGLAPAVIAPYARRRLGEGRVRALFLTGQRINATQAQAIGLVTEVIDPGPHDTTPNELEQAVAQTLNNLVAGGPQAQRATKELLLTLRGASPEEARTDTTTAIARLRVGAEGQEGMSAFLEKRPPLWVSKANT